jgi:hypothetical protein
MPVMEAHFLASPQHSFCVENGVIDRKKSPMMVKAGLMIIQLIERKRDKRSCQDPRPADQSKRFYVKT